jgi:hypothetical protein
MSRSGTGQEKNMAVKITLWFEDGKVAEVVPGARARIETERHYQGLGPQNVQEATFYMAWEHLRRSGEQVGDFESWIDTVADIEEEKVDDVRPTPPAQPAGTSSGSVSEQDSPSQP